MLTTQLFDVTVNVAPSQGGYQRTVSVRASSEATALVLAALELDFEGITRWTLLKTAKATS